MTEIGTPDNTLCPNILHCYVLFWESGVVLAGNFSNCEIIETLRQHLLRWPISRPEILESSPWQRFSMWNVSSKLKWDIVFEKHRCINYIYLSSAENWPYLSYNEIVAIHNLFIPLSMHTMQNTFTRQLPIYYILPGTIYLHYLYFLYKLHETYIFVPTAENVRPFTALLRSAYFVWNTKQY